ncbi:MAG TPA: NAD-dependent epimerase/dehydratase family protein [Bacteroidia bacterium]|nr:NAD-dependent epimerase/dehydratase family protein [Bacteroidia bacterium]
MNILVAGSKGFIGRNCERYFSAKHNVWGCDVLPAGESGNYFQIKNNSDFNTILSRNKFDLFINASGSAGVGFSIQNPEKDYELNVANVKVMLEAIRLNQPLCKFVTMSSAAVYGNPVSLPVAEKALCIPLSVYGKNKQEAEKIVTDYHEKSGITTYSLRIFSAYGPGLHKQLFWDIFQKTIKSKHITLFGTGNESRDFIFIDDLMHAIETIVIGDRFSGEAINVSSGVETTIREAAEMFLNYLGNDLTLGFSGEQKPGDPLNWRADISKLKSLGFQSVVDMKQGLKLVAADFLKNK